MSASAALIIEMSYNRDRSRTTLKWFPIESNSLDHKWVTSYISIDHLLSEKDCFPIHLSSQSLLSLQSKFFWVVSYLIDWNVIRSIIIIILEPYCVVKMLS